MAQGIYWFMWTVAVAWCCFIWHKNDDRYWAYLLQWLLIRNYLPMVNLENRHQLYDVASLVVYTTAQAFTNVMI